MSGSPSGLIDPNSEMIRQAIDTKASILALDLIQMGLDSNKVHEKVSALNSYSRYKSVQLNDALLLVSKIMCLSERQLKILEASLKKQNLIDSFKGGKLDLHNIFRLQKTITAKKKEAK